MESQNNPAPETLAEAGKASGFTPPEGYEFPSLLARVQAVIIDFILLLIFWLTVTYLIDLVGNVTGAVRGFILIFSLYLYDPIFVAFTGGTIGHHIMGMKVKKFNDPQRNIFVLLSLFRFFMKSALGWLSFLTITGNKEKRAIHDFASGSIVIRKISE